MKYVGSRFLIVMKIEYLCAENKLYRTKWKYLNMSVESP